ncbi:carbohydrate ABC transporter permease [Planococcus sp. X10-3]|uniref:carbohydrate ABC transporter permease n=1 Tax=Planococcus sp. X10-3 TaxID=3061240 RepID=UPI003BB185B0
MKFLRTWLKEILLIGMALLFLSPIYIIFINSFKTRRELYENTLAFPEAFTLEFYEAAMARMDFFNAFLNSMYVTLVSVLFIVILSSMTAWMLARSGNWISTIIFMTMIATMLIPFQTIMMPLMQMVTTITRNTGIPLYNSLSGLIFMNIGFHAALSVFLYHGFIKSIPLSLEEAATIDGASKLGVFWRVVFPILTPITATVMILNVILIWNDFLLPSLTLIDRDLRTIPLSVFYFFGEFTIEWNMAMAGLTLTIIPVVIFYIISQKYIIKGIGEGAVK